MVSSSWPLQSVSFLPWLTSKKPAHPSCQGHFASLIASELGTVPVLLFLIGQHATDVSLHSDAALKGPHLLNALSLHQSAQKARKHATYWSSSSK